MKEQKERVLYVVCIITSFLLSLSVLLPWIFYEEESYTILAFYGLIRDAGGLAAFARADINIAAAAVFLALPLLGSALSFFNGFFRIIKGRKQGLSYMIYGTEWVYMAAFFAFGGYTPTIWTASGPVLALADFLLNRYLEDYKAYTKKSREMRETEKREREERKRRLAFPGKYSPYLFRILVRNLKYRRRSYLLLLACGSFSVTCMFATFGIQNILSGMHSEEALFLGNGLQKTMKEAVVALLIMNIVMMAFSFLCYAKNKAEQEEKVLMVIGSRKSLIKMAWAAEYGICLLTSLAAGCLLGNGIVRCFSLIVREKIKGADIRPVNGKVYVWTIGVFVLVTCFSLAVNYELYANWKGTEIGTKKREMLPKTRRVIIGTVLGTILIVAAVYCYSQRRNAESSVYTYLFLAGAVIWFLYVGAVFLRIAERGRGHYRDLLGRIPFTVCFRKSMRTLAILFAFHFLVLSTYTSQLAGIFAAEDSKELYPYDFVCMGDEGDEELFARLEEEGAEVKKFPMVRVTTLQGEAYDWQDAASNNFLGVLWPQGQHIGIAEETYRALTGKALGLKGEEIHIVFQQDMSFRAHPLDWYLLRREPHIRIGQPLRSYDVGDRENIYPARTVKSEEIGILTGMFGRGMQENIVVFSDDCFAGLKGEGPDSLYLVTARQSGYEETKKALEPFRERHSGDSSWDDEIQPYYERRQFVKDTETERFFKVLVAGFEWLMLAVCGILVLSLKFVSELGEMKTRHRLLYEIGMPKADRRSAVRREIRKFFILPFLAAAVSAGIFHGILLVLRMYDAGQIAGYVKYGIWTAGIYGAVWLLFYQFVKRKLYRALDIEGNGGKGV